MDTQTVRCANVLCIAFFLLISAGSIGCGNDSAADTQETSFDPRLVEPHNEFGQRIKQLGGHLNIRLDLSHTDLTDEQLARLELPDNLVEISLADTRIADDGVKHLLRAQNLQTINLARTKITGAVIEDLRKLPKLTQADIQSEGVSPAAMLDLLRFLRTRQFNAKQTKEGE